MMQSAISTRSVSLQLLVCALMIILAASFDQRRGFKGKPSAYRKGQRPAGASRDSDMKKLNEESLKLHHKEILDKKLLTVKNNLHMKNLYDENMRMQLQAQQEQMAQYQQTLQQVYAGQNIVMHSALPNSNSFSTPQRQFSHDVIAKLLARRHRHGSVYLAKIHEKQQPFTIPKSVPVAKKTKSPVHKISTSKTVQKKSVVTKKKVALRSEKEKTPPPKVTEETKTHFSSDSSDETAPAHEILKKLMRSSSKTYSEIHKSKTAVTPKPVKKKHAKKKKLKKVHREKGKKTKKKKSR